MEYCDMKECESLIPRAIESKPLAKRRKITSTLYKLWHTDWFPWIPARYVLALVSCLGFVNVYVLRVNLSMALIVMVKDSKLNSTTSDGVSYPVYDWNDSQEGWVLAAFFYGYLLTQVPGGWLAGRFGGKYVFGIGILMTALLTLLTPLAAQLGVWAIIVLRVLEGVFEGVTFPAMYALWGVWAPHAERSRLVSFSSSGQNLGSVISFPLSAVICKYIGWPSVFYIFGTLSVGWFLLWLLLGFDSPATHPRISTAERNYIETSIETVKLAKVSTPWIQIFTSHAVWGIIIAAFCANYGFYTLLTCLPTYFKDVLNLDLKKGIIQNGLYSALPFLVELIVIWVAGPLADLLRAKCCSTKVVRKLFTTAAFLGSAVFLILCAYVGDSQALAVTFLTLGVGMLGLCFAGHTVNHVDIAPRFAGVLMGISNTAGTLPGILGPQIAKLIAVKPHSDPNSLAYRNTFKEEWREVFIISAEVYIFGALVYLILAEGKKQWWADGVGTRPVKQQSDRMPRKGIQFY